MANLLARRDQENLAHTHHITAATKPLNSNIRTLHPKTPANVRNPPRVIKNDENQPQGFTGKKFVGNEGPTKLDKNAFFTPSAPRNRAPLQAKTTNAKAFQTPGPLTIKPGRTAQQKHSTSAKRSGRSKITIATSTPTDADVLSKQPAEEEEPDFGYAPSQPIELPDPPFDLEPDPELVKQIQQELAHDDGVHYPYGSPKDEHGVYIRLKQEEEDWKQFDEARIQQTLQVPDRPVFPSSKELDAQVDKMISAGPRKSRAPLTRVGSTEARSAVTALSESQPRLPSAATRPTQASQQKARGVWTSSSARTPVAPPSVAPTRPNHAAVSKNTIGFPKAKKAASILPRTNAGTLTKPAKINQASIHPRDFRDLYGSPPEESDMWFRLRQFELLEQETEKDQGVDRDDLFENDFFPFDNSKLEHEDFQLPLPE